MVDIVNGVKHVELPGSSSKRSKRRRTDSATKDDKAVSPSPQDQQLRENVKQETAFVRGLVDTIPPTFYFATEVLEAIDYHSHSAPNVGNRPNGQRAGGSDGPNPQQSKKSRQKRDRLDHEQSKTVSAIHELLSKAENQKPKKRPKNIKSPDIRLNSMDELKARLVNKLATMRGTKPSNDKEANEKKALKRRMSKLKLKERRKQAKTPLINGGSTSDDADKKAAKPVNPPKPVYNQEGKMVFSKFDFSDGGGAEPGRKRGRFAGKNYKDLLTKVKRDADKLQELEKVAPERAAQMKEKLQWQAALEKTEGLKVKNDPVKLQQAVKRQEKRKASSGKKWESRADNVSTKIEARQKRRSTNLQSRKKDKIKNKIKKAVKRGRLVPGFS